MRLYAARPRLSRPDPHRQCAPRRWDIENITKFMLCLGPISSIFDYVTYGTLVVCIWRLEQPAAVPDWVVCRIAADPDANHPDHSHRKDPVFSEPCEQCADRDDGPCGRRRGSPTLFPVGAHTRFRSAAGKLLVGRVRNYPWLLHDGAFGQELVRAALGTLRQPEPRARRIGKLADLLFLKAVPTSAKEKPRQPLSSSGGLAPARIWREHHPVAPSPPATASLYSLSHR